MTAGEQARLRLQSLRDGRVRLGPRVVHLDLVDHCNARCITCWDHSPLLRAPRRGPPRAMSATLARALLGELRDAGLQAVILSGMGEPFLHPEIYDLIAAAHADAHVTVITNLVAADGHRALQAGVDQMLVGIHAATPATYAAFHPGFGPCEWDRLLATLRLFRDAGRRLKHVHVVCAPNAGELPAMIDLGAELHAERVTFKLASLGAGTERVRIGEEQRIELLERLVPEARQRAGLRGVAHNLDMLETQLRTGGADTVPIHEIGCHLGYDYARVASDGRVFYCCNTEALVGTIADAGDFTRLWRGPEWAALRARLAREDFLPGCRRCGKLGENLKLKTRLAGAGT